jgi:threonine dehydratase
MPETAPQIKKDAVAGYGAEIIFCEPTASARKAHLAEVVDRTGATFIHAYDNPHVIAGQGTAALELCEGIPDLDVVIAPVSGGGLLSGTALAVSAIAPKALIYGAEPQAADDAHRSLHTGKIVPSENPTTIADGLRMSLSELTFSIISTHATDIVTVSEEAIVQAMRHIWDRMKVIVEPSAAVTLAAVLARPEEFSGKRMGVILSGGNVDLSNLPW